VEVSVAKTICSTCGVAILPSTAAANGGKCVPCATGTRGQLEAGRRRNLEWRERMRRKQEAVERIQRREQPVFADFLAEDDPIAILWSFLVGAAYRNGSQREDVEALSPAAKLVYFAQVLDGEVMNGGFRQFFANGSGRYAHEALFALRELGAPRAVELLRRAIAQFPGERVPQDHAERNRLLETLDAAGMDALDTEYYGLDRTHAEDLSKRILEHLKRHAAARVLQR
jgi:hypothetical protein